MLGGGERGRGRATDRTLTLARSAEPDCQCCWTWLHTLKGAVLQPNQLASCESALRPARQPGSSGDPRTVSRGARWCPADAAPSVAEAAHRRCRIASRPPLERVGDAPEPTAWVRSQGASKQYPLTRAGAQSAPLSSVTSGPHTQDRNSTRRTEP